MSNIPLPTLSIPPFPDKGCGAQPTMLLIAQFSNFYYLDYRYLFIENMKESSMTMLYQLAFTVQFGGDR